MSEPILGTDVILSIGSVPLLCATDMTYAPDVDMIERTGPNSTGRERIRGLEDHKATVSGVSHILSDEVYTYFDIWVRRALEQPFEISFEDSEGNARQLSGLGVFGSMPLNAPAEGFANSTIEIFFNGKPSLEILSGDDSVGSG
jgi:hypothetical protein